ncbi:MAG: DNA polymerase III subunit delta [Deltaproteobacteria bacterium]
MALKSVYYLYGSEDYLIEETLSSIKAEALAGPFASMNYQTFEGRGGQAAEIISAASTMPAFADKRVVVVKDAGALKADELTRLAEYVKDPNPAACLVFTSDSAKIAKDSAFFKALEEKKCMKACGRLSEDDMYAWIRNEAKKESRTISDSAVRRLMAIAGNRLRDVKGEFDKVVLYAGEKTAIEASDVEDACMICREETSFALGDAIVQKNVKKALKIYERLSEEAPIMVLGAISWKIRMVARSFTRAGYKKTIDRLYAADRALKTSSQPVDVVLPALIIDLCRKDAQ